VLWVFSQVLTQTVGTVLDAACLFWLAYFLDHNVSRIFLACSAAGIVSRSFDVAAEMSLVGLERARAFGKGQKRFCVCVIVAKRGPSSV